MTQYVLEIFSTVFQVPACKKLGGLRSMNRNQEEEGQAYVC